MERNVTFGIATCNNQCVGYWGHDSHCLATKLKKLLARKADTKWQIISPSSVNPISISLSTSGLSDSVSEITSGDIWVRMEENSLTLGRQAFGRMPLYWMQSQEVIWFASQLQLLLALISSASVNISALYGYSCFSYVPTPLTPVKGIMAVPRLLTLLVLRANYFIQ